MLNLFGNEAQQKAIKHGAGPMLVLAGPGSGKTFVITKRIKYLIEHYQVEPSEILVITFTKAAAKEMKQRFFSLCQGACQPVNFGTFHAVYYSILKDYYHYDSHSILTEKEKKQILSQVLKAENFGIELHGELLEGLLTEISIIKNNPKLSESFSSAYLNTEDFKKLFLSYEKMLNIAGKVDFDDMVIKCLELLSQRDDILKKWQRMFRYILIDEFQDINEPQYQIIRMLAEPENNLFVVGDDDQSIYKFRGAKPEILFRFKEDYTNTETILLNINYRSTKQIVAFAGQIICQNKIRYHKEIIAAGEEGKCVDIEMYEDKRQAYDALIQKLQKEQEQKSLSKCAVIFRTSHGITVLSKLLTDRKISFYAKENVKSIYDHSICEDIKACLLFVNGNKSRNLFFRFMNKPMRYISREYIDETVDFDRLLRKYREKPWMRETIQLLKYHLQKMETMPVYLAIHYFRKAMGYDEYLKSITGNSKDKREELYQIADMIQETAKGIRTVVEWCSNLDEKKEQYAQSRKMEQHNSTDSVTLLTMHGSKGLEYEKVFIPDCNEGTIPHRKAKKPEEVEEERRLFYVAVTRAKKELYLQYITGTKDNPSFPSRFLS